MYCISILFYIFILPFIMILFVLSLKKLYYKIRFANTRMMLISIFTRNKIYFIQKEKMIFKRIRYSILFRILFFMRNHNFRMITSSSFNCNPHLRNEIVNHIRSRQREGRLKRRQFPGALYLVECQLRSYSTVPCL